MNQYRNIRTGRLYRLYKVTPPKYTGSWYEMVDTVTGETKQFDELEFNDDFFQETIENDSRLFCPKCGRSIVKCSDPKMDKAHTSNERVVRHWECSHCGQKGEAIYALQALVVAKKKPNKKKKRSEKRKRGFAGGTDHSNTLP